MNLRYIKHGILLGNHMTKGEELFLGEIREFLDPDQVMNGEMVQDMYGTTTLSSKERNIHSVAFPKSSEQIVKIVTCASEHSTSLYPISLGKNWGYGSASPQTDGCVVLDLSRMDSILNFDENLGTVTVEPGVTFLKLSNFLRKKKVRFLCPTTGAGPHTSVLGNALERGVGASQQIDRFGSILGVEAVLGDGSIYKSFPDRMFYKWGLGPYLDGLFGQSNIGIVTKMTFALERKPEKSGIFFFEIPDTKRLDTVVDMTRQFLSQSKNVPVIRIHNYERFFPLVQGSKKKYPRWLFLAVIQGNEYCLKALQNTARAVYTKPIRRSWFFSREVLKILSSVHKKFPIVTYFLPYFINVKAALNLANGNLLLHTPKLHIVTGDTVESLDVENKDTGFIFFYAALPMEGTVVQSFLEKVESICATHKCRAPIALHNVSERCLLMSLRIIFSKSDVEESLCARECEKALIAAGFEFGVYPSRLTIDSMKDFIDVRDPFWATAQKVKNALDPHGIISPGRYGL